MAKKKLTATHRLRRAHGVIFDPDRHFTGEVEPDYRGRCVLPAGTHVIPTENELKNAPDRFESLSSPEQPATKETIEDESEADGPQEEGDPDQAVDEALASVGGAWDALTAAQLKELAEGYGITEAAIEGSGSGGSVLKADWTKAVQSARG